MSNAPFTGHIDFALSEREINVCVVCCRRRDDPQTQHRSRSWRYVEVTPAGRYPIHGLVGVCCGDEEFPNKKKIVADWRQKAPDFIRLFRDLPIQLVARGRCDDKALAQAIRDVFAKVPSPSRKKVIDYVLSSDHSSTTGKGMRFEALDRWPKMGIYTGMNMDCGHAIRLRASHVKRATNESLLVIIAHELAHTEQNADNLRLREEESELDVESRLRSWGFDVQAAKKETGNQLLSQVNEIIRLAKLMRERVRSSDLPSDDSLFTEIAEAKKVDKMLSQFLYRWGHYEAAQRRLAEIDRSKGV